mgnify:CR=1 FL=1
MESATISFSSKAVVLSPIKLTPRTWLACERTLLAWLHLAVILAAVAAGVQTSASSASHTTAIILMIPALLFVVYATAKYYRRTYELRHRRLSTYDDQWGPFLLTVTMCTAVAFNLAHHLSIFMPHNDAFVYPY